MLQEEIVAATNKDTDEEDVVVRITNMTVITERFIFRDFKAKNKAQYAVSRREKVTCFARNSTLIEASLPAVACQQQQQL